MNKPAKGNVSEFEREIDWTVNFLKLIQGIRHNKETKVRVVNLLVREEARIQLRPREIFAT